MPSSIYYGFWFSPEREMLQALIDKSQEHVEGEVTLKLYKGNVIVIGRSSPKSLYSDKIVTFEDDAGAYDQKDAAGLHQAECAQAPVARQAQPLVLGPSPNESGCFDRIGQIYWVANVHL